MNFCTVVPVQKRQLISIVSSILVALFKPNLEKANKLITNGHKTLFIILFGIEREPVRRIIFKIEQHFLSHEGFQLIVYVIVYISFRLF